MVIATFNAATGWAGKTITHDDGEFTLEGHGAITAEDVLSYDAAGHIGWAYDGLREWVSGLVAPPAGADMGEPEPNEESVEGPRKLRKLTMQAKPHMDPDETVLASVLGTYECKIMGQDSVRAGALFATEHRIIFYAKKMGGYELESFPYGHIASFEAGKSLMGPHLKFIASGNTVTIKWINGDPAPLEAIVKQHMHASTQPAVASGVAAAPVPAAEDHAESLRKLKSLLDQQLITPEEYEAKRAEVLARM